MKRVWTKSQRQAIDAKGGSIIVSAAAGSGKTAVLVERVISQVTDKDNPIDADRILVVTYTRAAAAELKERLTAKINELVKNDPFNKALLRQQSLINKAQISTIHSFCSSLVKEFFYVLNIDRNFRLANDGELQLIKSDAMRLTLDSMYADGEPDFFRLVEAFSGNKDDKALENVILSIYEFLRSHPYPQWWIKEKLDMFTQFDSVHETVWYKLIIDYAKDACEFMSGLIESSYKQLNYEPYISEKMSPLIESDEAFLERLRLSLEHPTQYSVNDALDSFVSGRITGLNDYKEHPIRLSVARNRDDFKDVIKKLKKIFRFSEQECKEQISQLYVISSQLFNCVTQFSDNFQRLKAAKKVADYSDLEHWTIKLLVDENTREFTDIAAKVRTRFDQIMVDEYQDANETQDLIFSALSNNEENLFFVGDVKQSIYGFRQAMPQLFLNRKNRSNEYSEEECQFPAKIFLDKNFRSIYGVTDIVNFFFYKLMSESVGDIDYNDTESLKCGAVYDEENDASVEYQLLDYSNVIEPDVTVIEATHIAQQIQRMIAKRYQVKDGDTYRDVTYGDFAVLMRKKGEAPLYTDTLIACGVPASCEVSTSFVNAPEIVLMTNFLSVIDNPALDVELLSVLMSPIFGFTPDDLAEIRRTSRYSTLYRAVLIKANEGNEKCKHFVSELSYYRDICVTTPVAVLLNTLYQRTGYMSIVSAVSDTDIAENNLKLLKEYAKEFESGSGKGLSRFVSYLNRLRQNGSDVNASIDVSASSYNCVRVMSIHASKGLEFPVCIVANTTRKFSSDVSDNVLKHSDFGIAVKHLNQKANVSDTTMPRQGLALAIKRDEMSEELRVLYVAMTRAKQKLIMMSSHKSVMSHLNTVSTKLCGGSEIMPYTVKGCTYLCEWLTMCAMLHPDGKVLRDLVNCDIEPDNSVKSPMKIEIFNIADEEELDDFEVANEIITETAGDITDVDTAVIDTLKERTGFEYKKAALSKLPSKVSASELSHKLSDKAFDRILDTPAFMSDSTLTAAGKGTALHAFMQFCDFKLAKADIEEEISRLCDKGFISQIQADSIDREKALRFVSSDLIERCNKSDEVYKEYRFTVKVDASTVDPELPPNQCKEQIILQGAVDLAFVENGELVIVDYKTDKIKEATALYDMYHNQLEIYKDAMEQCTDYKVKECLIYSVHLGESVKI